MFCPKCGAQNADDVAICSSCGYGLTGQPQAAQPTQMPVSTLKTSPMAIWSLVLGIVALLTCGISLLWIPGIILGILALKRINEKPQELAGKGVATAGIVISGIAILSITLGFILAAILFPVFARAREAARKATCLNNMKQIAQAVKMYSDDYDGMLPSSALNKTTKVPTDYCTKLCLNGQYPPSGRRETWPQVLRDNMKDVDIMWCPSDSIDRSPSANPEVSYWYKFALDKAWRDLGKKKIADLGYESDQIVFFEHKGWHFSDVTGLKRGVQINVSYADTHVETVTLPNQAPPDSSPIVRGEDSDQPYEPFYFNVRVDSTGNPTDAPGAPLDPSKYCDPSKCYDKM